MEDLEQEISKDSEIINCLKESMREIYEVYAGSDGFIPETAPEGYQQKIIKDMVDIAKKHL